MSRHSPSLIGTSFFLFGMLIIGSMIMAGGEPAPKVYLNHFFLNVESRTYRDIVKSDFIKNEFAHFEERTTVVDEGEPYSGACIYGENTYFEFFDASKSQDFVPEAVTSGIAFGVDKKDELKIIRRKLKDHKNSDSLLGHRELERIQISWYYASIVSYGNIERDIMTWVMEFHEDFLKKWHPDLEPSSPGVRRKDILKRYSSKIAKPCEPKEKILKDVIQINLDLTKKDMELLKGELDIFDYVFSHEKNQLICSGPEVKLAVTLIESGRGRISGIRMSCRSSKSEEEIFSFGKKSRLVLHTGNTATWIF